MISSVTQHWCRVANIGPRSYNLHAICLTTYKTHLKGYWPRHPNLLPGATVFAMWAISLYNKYHPGFSVYNFYEDDSIVCSIKCPSQPPAASWCRQPEAGGAAAMEPCSWSPDCWAGLGWTGLVGRAGLHVTSFCWLRSSFVKCV